MEDTIFEVNSRFSKESKPLEKVVFFLYKPFILENILKSLYEPYPLKSKVLHKFLCFVPFKMIFILIMLLKTQARYKLPKFTFGRRIHFS